MLSLEGLARCDAVIASDGGHEQAVGLQPEGHDVQEEVPDKGLLEDRREGATEAPHLLLVGAEGRQDEEYAGDDEDRPAGCDAEPAAVLMQLCSPLPNMPRLRYFLLGVVGLIDLVQAHTAHKHHTILGPVEVVPTAAPADHPIFLDIELPNEDCPVVLAVISAGPAHLRTCDFRHYNGPYFGERIAGVLILSPGEYLPSRTT